MKVQSQASTRRVLDTCDTLLLPHMCVWGNRLCYVGPFRLYQMTNTPVSKASTVCCYVPC